MANYGQESISLDTIEGLPKVDEVNKMGCIALLKNVSQSKNLNLATTPCSEPCFSSLQGCHIVHLSVQVCTNYILCTPKIFAIKYCIKFFLTLVAVFFYTCTLKMF